MGNICCDTKHNDDVIQIKLDEDDNNVVVVIETVEIVETTLEGTERKNEIVVEQKKIEEVSTKKQLDKNATSL